MDWVGAIEVNRAALSRIVAALVALLAAQGAALRLPLPVYREIALALHRAESAVRRLIVVAARNLVVPLGPSRPMPPGLVIACKGQQRRMAFQLFDNRQSFPVFSDVQTNETAITGPRIRMIGDCL